MSTLKLKKSLTMICVMAVLVFCGMFAVSATAGENSCPLRDYVAKPQEVFDFEVVRTVPLDKADLHVVRLTSQQWRDLTWTHWMFIMHPHERRFEDKAMLFITGGRNTDEPPQLDIATTMIASALSEQIGSIVAVLMQVPNQPIKDGRWEDDLIAYTFKRYLETGDPEYPLLFPMTKSATAAMDAISRLSQQYTETPIDSFFVCGPSKRGWTTWLTAAVDDRVTGIAPMVIDVLNMGPQMERQLKSYGQYSVMIQEYVDYGVLDMELLETERGQQLLAMVDPYAYRDAITVPKLIALGTNDPYWTVDAANLYVPDLVGLTYLHYSPNAGHDLQSDSAGGVATSLQTLASFARLNFAGEDLPELIWHHEDPNTLVVQWDDPEARPILWSARSGNRDFRQSRWHRQDLEGQQRVEVAIQAPDEGWGAWFVEVQFGGAYPMRLSTAITVLPEAFPFKVEDLQQ